MVKIPKQPSALSPKPPRAKSFKIEKRKSTKAVRNTALKKAGFDLKPKKEGNSNEANDKLSKLKLKTGQKLESSPNVAELKLKKKKQLNEGVHEAKVKLRKQQIDEVQPKKLQQHGSSNTKPKKQQSEANSDLVHPKKLQHGSSNEVRAKPKKQQVGEANNNLVQPKKLKQQGSSNEVHTKPKKQQIAEANSDLAPNEMKPLIPRKSIKSAIQGVLKLRQNNRKFKNQLLTDTFPLHLQISCHRVPEGHPKILRAALRHSPHAPDAEICIIVPDLKGVPIKEHELHVEHYENLFQRKGIEGIKKIMTLHEFKTEHETFEQKIRLAQLYDVFLSDARICGKAVKHGGKVFYSRHKVPTPVKLQATKLREHLEKKIRTSMLHLHLKGNSYNIRFGNSGMDLDKLIDNVESVIEFLDESFPGGIDNISGIYAYTFRTTTIPIYLSGKSPDEIPAPKVPEKVPKAYRTHRGELTTFPDVEVVVQPTGDIRVITKSGVSSRKRKREEKMGEGKKKKTVSKKKVENGRKGKGGVKKSGIGEGSQEPRKKKGKNEREVMKKSEKVEIGKYVRAP